MNSPLKTLIVDDEPAARQRLRVLLQAHPELEVVAEVGSVAEAAAFLLDQTPGLVLLDMEMPGGSGLGLELHLGKATRTVFVTAYPDYALKAFQFGAVDFGRLAGVIKLFCHAVERMRQQAHFVLARYRRPAREIPAGYCLCTFRQNLKRVCQPARKQKRQCNGRQ